VRHCLAHGNKADFQCLRFDYHTRDVAFDQLAIRKGAQQLRSTRCCKVPADPIAHEGLDLLVCNIQCWASWGLLQAIASPRPMTPA
jgi:hypothetical protein